MGSTFQFIEAPGSPSSVLEWFRGLDAPPEQTPTSSGVLLYFRSLGPLVYTETETIDTAKSPVVSVVLPRVRRDILWTVGEVHFLSTLSMSQNRSIRNVARSFARWIKTHELVYERSLKAENPFAYYLEGSSKNWGAIYAFPSGLAELKRGRYFVSDNDNDTHLDTLCRTLRLRGVVCGPS